MNDFGKILIFTGGAFIMAGVIFLVMQRLPGGGRLPGDILIKKDDFTFFFPLTTCIILSVVLSVILHFVRAK